jgi:hypothetical protein
MEDGEVLTQREEGLQATTLVGRRCSCASSADGIGLRRIEGQNLLQWSTRLISGCDLVDAQQHQLCAARGCSGQYG